MVKKIKFLLGLLIFVGQSVLLAGTPVLKEVPVKEVYVPSGFDDNDQSEVIVEGELPNLCHQHPQTSVEVKNTKIIISLKSLYYHDSNPYCPQVQVPFIISVQLGVLKKGQYDVIVNRQNGPLKKRITIGQSQTQRSDDYVYAKVEYVNKTSGSREVQLLGENPSNCFELDRIETITNDKNTFSILPIMRQIADECIQLPVKFSYRYIVPSSHRSKKVLLHVRSMDGKSVNSIYTYE